MANESYWANQIIANCEWYFGRQVQLITFNKGSTGYCIVVPAQSTLRSSAQCRASDILISGSASNGYVISTLYTQVMTMIGNVYTVNENGNLSIDESNVPPECLLPDPISSPRRTSLEPGEATKTATPTPLVEMTPLPMEQVMTDLKSSSQNTEDLTHRATGASEMPESLDILNDTVTANSSPQIPSSPVTVEDIWPFIQQIADAITGHPGGPLPDLGTLGSMTLADIQASRDRRIEVMTSAGADQAAQVNRDMVREEVDRALAEAVANLGRLLSGGVSREN